MLTRRRFSALAAGVAGAALAPASRLQATAARSGVEFGVQLYSVRDEIADLPATLRLIRSIGYTSVETFPPVYDRPAKVLKALINEAGLKVPSGLFDYATLEENVDYAAELGLEYMICAMIPRPLWDPLDGFHQAAEYLNKVAAKAKTAGLRLGYHPFNYDYRRLEGGRGIDVLLREFDPAIRLELDLYWAVEGHQNPLELMKAFGQRLELIHIKDRQPVAGFTYTPDPPGFHFTEAGTGTIDWKADLGEARRMGVTQFFVDQDKSYYPMAKSLRLNWIYLSQLAF